MAFSAVGRKKLAVYIFLLLLDIAVIALATRVNRFQEFFFMADLFPLALSVVTLILLLVMLAMDVTIKNTFMTRPPFEIGLFCVLSILWLAFNAFSTMRWRFVPLNCTSIPPEYDEERGWCRDLQGLKFAVWVLWLSIFLTAASVLRYAYSQHRKGNRHVWNTPLSRFKPHLRPQPTFVSALDRQTITDYFGPDTNAPQPWEKF
ncbi:hypothetical protein BXZ70DRAFT_1065896 [Cristinia sonorae]|uniref:MARVEL domain-containing protein n=1 Tax=Cristinia sonorae TaxID=1940300 RepID=A0A8K0UKF8_9AGAR|nr:hypothetical protein BXZ70DRAFT_1065896 [Cristinia sonorae]